MANLNKGGENATNLYKEALAQAQKRLGDFPLQLETKPE